MSRIAPFTLAAILLLAGCGGPQSMFGTRNPGGAAIESFWWIAFLTTGALSLVTMLVLIHAVRRARRAGLADLDGASAGDRADPGRAESRHRAEPGHTDSDRAEPGHTDFDRAEPGAREEELILVVGGLIPLAVLVGLLVVSVRVGGSVVRPPGEPTRTVEVIGHMFWWEVRYPDAGVVTANELHIPAGESVTVHVSSADVIHSFWVPQLSPGKVDMMPGRTNAIWMFAQEPGRYRGQCTEFCGAQHALMSLEVVAMPPGAFEDWLEARRAAASPPADAERARGFAVYMARGCAVCHSIQGVTSPDGPLAAGPDLTDLGARRTLGALTVPNTPAMLARWIADPHELKPGVRMPATDLPQEDLDALVSYLSGLAP